MLQFFLRWLLLSIFEFNKLHVELIPISEHQHDFKFSWSWSKVVYFIINIIISRFRKLSIDGIEENFFSKKKHCSQKTPKFTKHYTKLNISKTWDLHWKRGAHLLWEWNKLELHGHIRQKLTISGTQADKGEPWFNPFGAVGK